MKILLVFVLLFGVASGFDWWSVKAKCKCYQQCLDNEHMPLAWCSRNCRFAKPNMVKQCFSRPADSPVFRGNFPGCHREEGTCPPHCSCDWLGCHCPGGFP